MEVPAAIAHQLNMIVSELMFTHIAAGTVAVAAGAVAVLAPKGEAWHRAAGTLFVLTMFVSAAAGAVAAFEKPLLIAALAGAFTCYLVVTAWLTVSRTTMGTAANLAALAVALGICVISVLIGLDVQQAIAAGAKDAFGAEPYFFFAGLALIGAAGDAAVAFRGGVAGAQRIARHLWRMMLALYIAVGSAFAGPGAAAFPKELQGSLLLAAPEPVVLALLVFWLAYTFVSRRFR
jgi:uncharacterized membrane protein